MYIPMLVHAPVGSGPGPMGHVYVQACILHECEAREKTESGFWCGHFRIAKHTFCCMFIVQVICL